MHKDSNKEAMDPAETNSANPHWAKTNERGSAAGIMFLLYTFKFLGATVCKLFMSPTLLYYFLFNRSARLNQLQYLQKLHNHVPDAPSPTRWNVLKIFFNFGFGVVDRMAAWHGQVNKFKLSKVNNQDFLDLRNQQKGAVIMVAHLGNFEISRMASKANQDAVFNVFMHTKNAQKYSQVMKKFNPDFVTSIIEGDALNMQMAINLKEKVEAGEFVVIAGDRTPVNNKAAVVEVDFLGDKANLPIGPYVLAKVLDCPLLGLFCIKQGGGYKVYFETFAEKIKFSHKDKQSVLQSFAQKYANKLELLLKEAPLQWYNFHNFWNKD